MENPNEEFMQALYKNDVSLLHCFLNKGVNINKICSNGMTLLGTAAQTGNLAALKALLEHHLNLNLDLRNENLCKPHYLPLDSSEQRKYKNIGYFVVCKDVEENEFGDGPTPDGMDALEWDMEVTEGDITIEDSTLEEHDLNMYKWYANILTRTSILLDSPERDLARLDRHGQSVLHYAVNSGNTDMVKYLLTILEKDLSINQTDACCFTPLHIAAGNGDIEMTRLLLNKGANVNAIGGRLRENSLQVAVRGAFLHIVKLLVEAGADITAVDVEEHSVLTCAARCGCVETIKYLIKKGARVNHEEPGGVTALRLAVWANNTPAVKVLIDGGARVIHSHHLIHVAVSNNNVDIVKILLDSGAVINSKDDQGQTALMVACSRKNISIAKYLLSRGADANAASHIDGKTALHVCVQDVREAKCIYQLVDLLVNYGADMDASSYQGNVLFYSIILENRTAATALVQRGADVNLKDERAYVDNLSLAKRHGDLDLVRLLVYGGFKLSEMSWDPRALRTKSPDPACDFLVHVKTNPLNLKEICRIVIRRKIGPVRMLSRIQTLPIPVILQKYLALEIF
ncbi:unnamed protein product [Phyllotreta striolata]|uniref:SOCS box domain-containing protein n=1 Tax=Phyllotreta striolata TaxID=444603 RepID=A0A9N9XPV0_PHYSR|nr:unnamed protein product [Phyllotreta striolata]